VRDWEQYVRTHLSLPDLARERESRILRELSSQLEDIYREAVARGMTESDADAHTRSQITDWTHLAATLREADRPHARSDFDRWSERMDDHAREKRGRWLTFANLWQDIRYASRRLAAQPGFTTVVVLTLALGIGANTAIFSIIDTLLLDSLPVDHPRELVLLNPTGLQRMDGWGPHVVVPGVSWPSRRPARVLRRHCGTDRRREPDGRGRHPTRDREHRQRKLFRRPWRTAIDGPVALGRG